MLHLLVFILQLGVNDNGVIQYINHTFYTDNGYIINKLLIVVRLDAYYNCYDRKPWTYTVFEVVTDTPSNSWCRAPNLSYLFIIRMVQYQ